jgi:hypothetical protein
MKSMKVRNLFGVWKWKTERTKVKMIHCKATRNKNKNVIRGKEVIATKVN